MKAIVIHSAFEDSPRAVASIDVADMKGDEALEYCYRVTQNIEGSWSRGPAIEWDGEILNNPDYNPNIELLAPLHEKNGKTYGLRSTSMGDQILLGNTKYEVSAVGFTEMVDYYGA